MARDFIQVSTAAESRESALALARSAVEARLAAGAQVVGPVASVVWHLGELIGGEEWQVLLRTRAELYPALEAHLIEAHPWKNPEVTAVPLVAASAGYMDWLDRATERA
jgi:periplasmic divalent cation tolerance protein